MQKDLVSVIIPVYNAEKYVEEAVLSICNQTYTNLEILVINDGSNDGTLKVLERLADRDTRIVLKSRENCGLQRTLNELINMSSGEYIARMDADDISKPNRIEFQKRYMDAHQCVDVLGSSMQLFGNDNRISIARRFSSKDQRQIRMMFYNAGIVHPTAFFRASSIYEKNLYYDEDNKGAEDYELWCDILEKGGVIEELEEVLLSYRVHSTQITSAKTDTVSDSRNFVRKREISKLGVNAEELFDIINRWYVEYKPYMLEQYIEALTTLVEANRTTKRFDNKLLVAELMYQWVTRAIANAKQGEWQMWRLRYMRHLFSPFTLSYVFKEILEDQRIIKANRT